MSPTDEGSSKVQKRRDPRLQVVETVAKRFIKVTSRIANVVEPPSAPVPMVIRGLALRTHSQKTVVSAADPPLVHSTITRSSMLETPL
ncbi:unnamed protein product [Ilex paraguariensis]|uniref:Uncharacterized protein n=1 Tax=Ilex paraguariensis TaxID=185542 RepID=A0ABC8SU43_9AQUA